MANVTDSLDAVIVGLAELEHLHDDLCDLLTKADHWSDEQIELSCLLGGRIGALLGLIRRSVTAERDALDRLQSLSRSLRCLNCNRPFEWVVRPGRMPLYCTPACRTAAYRARLDNGGDPDEPVPY